MVGIMVGIFLRGVALLVEGEFGKIGPMEFYKTN